jgi:hypothetical protein
MPTVSDAAKIFCVMHMIDCEVVTVDNRSLRIRVYNMPTVSDAAKILCVMHMIDCEVVTVDNRSLRGHMNVNLRSCFEQFNHNF